MAKVLHVTAETVTEEQQYMDIHFWSALPSMKCENIDNISEDIDVASLSSSTRSQLLIR